MSRTPAPDLTRGPTRCRSYAEAMDEARAQGLRVFVWNTHRYKVEPAAPAPAKGEPTIAELCAGLSAKVQPRSAAVLLGNVSEARLVQAARASASSARLARTAARISAKRVEP